MRVAAATALKVAHRFRGVMIAGALASGVAACSIGTLTPYLTSEPPADYVQIAARYVASQPQSEMFRGAMISSLQKTEGTQPHDWYACLRLNDGSYYAVFYVDKAVANLRRPVGVDRCVEPYRPMPPLPPAPKPAANQN